MYMLGCTGRCRLWCLWRTGSGGFSVPSTGVRLRRRLYLILPPRHHSRTTPVAAHLYEAPMQSSFHSWHLLELGLPEPPCPLTTNYGLLCYCRRGGNSGAQDGDQGSIETRRSEGWARHKHLSVPFLQ